MKSKIQMQATMKTKIASKYRRFFPASVAQDYVLFESKHPTSIILIWWTNSWTK